MPRISIILIGIKIMALYLTPTFPIFKLFVTKTSFIKKSIQYQWPSENLLSSGNISHQCKKREMKRKNESNNCIKRKWVGKKYRKVIFPCSILAEYKLFMCLSQCSEMKYPKTKGSQICIWSCIWSLVCMENSTD